MTTHPENDNVDHESPSDATADLKYCLLRTGPDEFWYHTHCSWFYHIKGTQTCEACKDRGSTNWLCFDANGKDTHKCVIACKEHTIEVYELMLRRCEGLR
jgi:hypothetical protein